MGSGRIAILQVNDTHGYLKPHPELMWNGREAGYPVLGGYAVVAGYYRDVREECGGAVLLLDNVDTFNGTHPVMQSKGDAIIPRLEAFGFDAMTAHSNFAGGQQHPRIWPADCSALPSTAARLPSSVSLDGRARHCSERAEHAAVTWLWTEQYLAAGAFIEAEACRVCRRLRALRGWSDEQANDEEVFPRGAVARGPDGL